MGVREGVPARAARRPLRKLELDDHDLLQQETILSEKMKERVYEPGSQTKWTRSSKAVESPWYQGIQRKKKKGTADTVRSPAETGYYYSGANQLSTLTLPIALSILGAGLEDQQTAYLEAAGAECLEPKRIWSDAECMQEIVGL